MDTVIDILWKAIKEKAPEQFVNELRRKIEPYVKR